MDAECAFCGRLIGETRQVLCDDCQAPHQVCTSCADDVAAGADGFRLEA